jgi:hypothetical protein
VTIDTFMEKLAQTPHTWVVEGLGQLRGYHHGVRCCPIQAVAGEENLDKAIKQLGLSSKENAAVMTATDFFLLDLPLHAQIAAATVNRSAQ